jgi:hypothetical protein
MKKWLFITYKSCQTPKNQNAKSPISKNIKIIKKNDTDFIRKHNSHVFKKSSMDNSYIDIEWINQWNHQNIQFLKCYTNDMILIFKNYRK